MRDLRFIRNGHANEMGKLELDRFHPVAGAVFTIENLIFH